MKPSNVKLTHDGQAKVLDFGLAEALENESSEGELQNSPTLSVAATRTGVLLGTAAYMSPEQARGKRVDRRADIWAFGCVFYEMLTGDTCTDESTFLIRLRPQSALHRITAVARPATSTHFPSHSLCYDPAHKPISRRRATCSTSIFCEAKITQTDIDRVDHDLPARLP